MIGAPPEAVAEGLEQADVGVGSGLVLHLFAPSTAQDDRLCAVGQASDRTGE